jgi:hypothetical protein
MATYDDSFLAQVESLVKETQARCFDEHAELVGDVMVALNLCFSLPFTSRALDGNTALGFACACRPRRVVLSCKGTKEIKSRRGVSIREWHWRPNPRNR